MKRNVPILLILFLATLAIACAVEPGKKVPEQFMAGQQVS